MQSALQLAREMGTNDVVISVLTALEGDKNQSGYMAYMPGLSVGMVEAGRLFDVLTNLKHSGRVQKIAISGSDGRGWGETRDYPTCAWPGVTWYLQELIGNRGLGWEDIIPISAGPQRQSLQETDAMLEQARNMHVQSVIGVSVEYHFVRQMLGCVKWMIRNDHRIKIYFPPSPFDWDKVMLGSQNASISTGRKEADIDWNKKVPDYQAKGDLATLADFQEYIKWRDG